MTPNSADAEDLLLLLRTYVPVNPNLSQLGLADRRHEGCGSSRDNIVRKGFALIIYLNIDLLPLELSSCTS